ncbi:MAG: pimeloyl-ACP methyl ester carboxylesterase [Oceanospirillaceae bacterium]|jgi:pimeloyl-ACP methyl ester carboxylesterase
MINWKSKRFWLLSVSGVIVALFMLTHQSDIPMSSLKLKYAKLPSNFVSVDGLSVHYRDVGVQTDSLPIVLLHGTGSSLHTWEGWVDELSKTRRVITLDLPAFGLTGPNANNDYSPEAYVEFTKQFIETFKIKSCVLGGNSLGGGIAWQTAAAYPELVKQLILVDATGYPNKAKSVPLAFRLAKVPVLNNLLTVITPRSVIENSVKNVYGNPDLVTDELVDRYFDLTLRPGNRKAFVARMQLDSYQDQSEKIKSLTQPTLIIWGEKDLLIPIENALKFAADLPNNKLVIYPELGHVPMEENPQETVKAVKAFLNIPL